MAWKICAAWKLAFSLFLAGLLAGCGGGGGGGSTGTLSVAMTDAVTSSFSSVVLSIREVRAAPAGKEKSADSGLPVIATFDPPLQVDVLTLDFAQQPLGEAALPAGKYHQVRLILADNTDPNDPANYVVLQGATEHLPLKTPSGQTSGLKVNAPGTFDVKAGEVNTILLDFDPARAIVQAGNSGNWIFKPTGIRIVQMADSLTDFGSLSGTVEPQEAQSTAIVSAVDTSDSVTVASGEVNPDDGSFRVFVPAGKYQVGVTADGFLPYSSAPASYNAIVGQDTPIGTITLTPSP